MLGCNGNKELIENRIKQLKYRITVEKDSNLLNLLKSRVSRLEGKSAIITVGGFTEVELVENRDKIVDGLNSCK